MQLAKEQKSAKRGSHWEFKDTVTLVAQTEAETTTMLACSWQRRIHCSGVREGKCIALQKEE